MKIQFKTLIIIAAALVLQACASSENLQVASARPALPEDCKVRVYSPGEDRPGDYEVLGTVKFGDAGFSVSCGEDAIREAMRVEACRVGANGIIVIKEKFPSLASTCYRATADLVYVK